MVHNESRFERHDGLFGKEGQQKLREATVTIIGCGGLGLHVTQLLSFLGVGKLGFIDSGELKNNNRNRYIGSLPTDPVPGTPKVDIATRLTQSIDPSIETEVLPAPFETQAAFEMIKSSDYVFGCVDQDGARMILNDLCIAYAKPLFDLASDVTKSGEYGGRVAVIKDGQACLQCLGLLDQKDIRHYLSSPEQLKNEAAVYGVPVKALKPETGPSVVSINGVVASLGVTEFMVLVTGLREPKRVMNYYGHFSRVSPSLDQGIPGCYFCSKFNWGEKAGVEQHLNTYAKARVA
jgi:molybdopterin-synthase adenylyltransferase